uniref:phosphotransferase n=1 Tax=Streptomyces sp. Agncl-13 TaxID=3400628 RepID=UPI003A86316B
AVALAAREISGLDVYRTVVPFHTRAKSHWADSVGWYVGGAPIAAAAAALTPHLTPGPIHGDALPRNVHVGPDGPVLVDLETFSADLREHDLVVMALSRDRYAFPARAYDSFTEAYGWDVREWAGCGVLRGARETASCAWVAQHAPSNPEALVEFRRRVASLRDGDETVRWFPF